MRTRIAGGSLFHAASFLFRNSSAFNWLKPHNKRADNSRLKATGYRLCVYASGSLITVILRFFTLINVSCLHFGQYSGKFSGIVSIRTRLRVLLPQTGHRIHFFLSNLFFLQRSSHKAINMSIFPLDFL